MPIVKKTLWTLNIDGYAPEITQLTYPLMLGYARKIGADFRIINQRRFPDMPLTYEKMQIFDLGRESDWNIYIDSDAVIFPDMIDVTERVPKDTVVHYGHDHASNRWRGDEYFRRDGRDIGSCNWFTVASNWCMDLWHPLDDLSLEEALARIKPILIERVAGITPEHLIDDYVLSRNIARYGLKFKTVQQIKKEDEDKGLYFWHTHTQSVETKAAEIAAGLRGMKLDLLDEIKSCEGMTPVDWMRRFGVYDSSVVYHSSSNSKPVDISKARDIFGWMSESELFWLGVQAQKHKLIVEIGSFHGRSTRALADNTDGIVWAIDTWKGSPEHQGIPEVKNAEGQFCENLGDLIDYPIHKVRPIKGCSFDIAHTFHIRTWNGPNPDMIFIDAAHDYESVKADIEAWRPLLAPGGLLCGHDFGDAPAGNTPTSEEWGVTRAVQELVPNFRRGPGSIWYQPVEVSKEMSIKHHSQV